MIVSFGLTEQEFMDGKKTVTRRRWKESTAKKFRKGTVHHAWNKLPFVEGARQIGTIRAVEDAYQERLGDITAAELVAEGGMCKSKDAFIALVDGEPDEILWVARFEII